MEEAVYYLKEAHENSLSRNVLLNFIKADSYIELALRDFNKPIGVAEYMLQFPEKEIKELINRELEEFTAEKNTGK